MTDATIVRGKWVVTSGGEDDGAIDDGAVLFEGDTIREVGAWDALRGAHPDATVLGSPAVAVMPGLINAHHHCNGMTGAHHGVPDLLLESWLPALSGARSVDIRLNTLLSTAYLLASGVTSVVDVLGSRGAASQYENRVKSALAAHDEAGMRVALAPGVATRSLLISGAGEDEAFLARLPESARADAVAYMAGAGDMREDDYLAFMDEIGDAYADHPRIDVWYGPPGPQWVSDGFLQRIAETAARRGVGVQTHVAESFYEKLHGPREYGKPTILHLRDLGVLGPRFSIAHGVWLGTAEIDAMAEAGASISHNPSSNLRLRAGIAPLNAMLDAGVNVALGMDGTTINDDEDMFAEMRLAPGYAADLVLVDLSRVTWPWVAPEADPRELLVMRARAGDVDTVIIDGEVVYRDGRPTRFDLDAVGREVAGALAASPFPEEAAARAARLRPHVEDTYLNWEAPALAPYTAYWGASGFSETSGCG